MHVDFSVFRTVSGPYDVPLDDPKPRFGQQRRKNRPRPCCRAHSFMVPPSILRGTSSRSSKRPHGREALHAAAAGAATPHALVVRAPERDHAHRRDRFYIPLFVRPPIPRRHMPPRLGKQLAPTHRRSRSLAPTLPRAADLFRSRYRPKAGVEPSGGEPHPRPARFMPLPMRLGTHGLSHPPPVRARRSAARGQCGRAELALRHRCLRCRPGGAAPRAEVLSWPKLVCGPPKLWNQASASPRRRIELLAKSRRHVATRDSRGHVERNVEHTAAVHMVALGCAHNQGIGRSCACGGRIQRLDHRLALNYAGNSP